MTTPEPEVIYLATLQFANGGLLDVQPTDRLAHAIRGTQRGTPGPTLCGVDRFAAGTPGWCVGGGVTVPGVVFAACPGCVEVAKRDFPGVPVAGIKALAAPLAAAIGVAVRGRSSGVPRPVLCLPV